MDINKLCQDASLDLIDYYVPDVGANLKDAPLAPALSGGQFQPITFEPDDPTLTLSQPGRPSCSLRSVGERSETDALVDTLREQRLFPNSFKISGLKHVCDNLTGTVLEALPQSHGMNSKIIVEFCCGCILHIPHMTLFLYK